MKNWIHLPVAAVVAAAVGAGAGLLRSPERSAASTDSGTEAAALRATLEELKAQQRTLSERLERLPAAPRESGASRAPVQDLDAAIAEYMARQLGGDGAGPATGDEPTPADLESAAIADRILAGQVKDDELQELWQKLRNEKRIDAVVAEIERQAGLSPNNPDLQCELGKAYLQKLFDVGIGPMAGVWGEKADKSFDQALALEETHWEARFQKAVSLSNVPAFLGKQSEAVRQFEILLGQQEQAAARPEHAYTYYFLGNMYDQAGDHGKAVDMWKRGRSRFPDSEELRSKEGK